MPVSPGRYTAPARAAASAARWTLSVLTQYHATSTTTAHSETNRKTDSPKMTTTWPRERVVRPPPDRLKAWAAIVTVS